MRNNGILSFIPLAAVPLTPVILPVQLFLIERSRYCEQSLS